MILKCSQSTNSLSDYTYSWTLKSDSLNFAILTVNEETYTLDSGEFLNNIIQFSGFAQLVFLCSYSSRLNFLASD